MTCWCKIRILASACLLLAPACVLHSPPLDSGLILPDEMEALPALPVSYRMVHHVRLEVRGRSYDFIGYLAVHGPNWRAVAFSELGGRLFDLLCRSHKKEVLFAPKGLSQKPLTEGVMNELDWIFAHHQPPRLPAPPLPPPIETSIHVLSFSRVDGWPSPVPERMSIRNHRWGYTMEVRLLRIDLRPVESDIFQTLDGGY